MISNYFNILLAATCLVFASSCAETNSPDEPSNPSGSSQNSSIKADGEVATEGAVDLGLSVKWAACDLGASNCFSSGEKYTWGDTRDNCLLNICGTEYDQATDVLGDGWQLPSYEQAKELFDKCRWTYSQYRGVDGYIVTGPSLNAIFIPVKYYSEDYWTGTCDINSNKAYSMYLPSYSWGSKSITEYSRTTRCYIRPVYVGS